MQVLDGVVQLVREGHVIRIRRLDVSEHPCRRHSFGCSVLVRARCCCCCCAPLLRHVHHVLRGGNDEIDVLRQRGDACGLLPHHALERALQRQFLADGQAEVHDGHEHGHAQGQKQPQQLREVV